MSERAFSGAAYRNHVAAEHIGSIAFKRTGDLNRGVYCSADIRLVLANLDEL